MPAQGRGKEKGTKLGNSEEMTSLKIEFIAVQFIR